MLRSLRQWLLLTPLLATYAFGADSPSQVTFSSGSERVALLELYTSEGCSSCPPADRWLSATRTDPGLWRDFVPVAFHVDYWDYIGWKDRFARRSFSDRQRRYAAQGGVRVVYTPGLFRNGTEWRGWRERDAIAGDDSKVGALELTVKDADVSARFVPAGRHDSGLLVHVAVLGMGLESDIRAGENAGKTLSHDFVVLQLASLPLARNGDIYSATTRLLPAAGTTGQAVVAWVSRDDRQAPIQATGGFL